MRANHLTRCRGAVPAQVTVGQRLEPDCDVKYSVKFMETYRRSTFTLNTVPEVHLPRAPLVKVLTQVQFSRTPSLVSDETEVAMADVLARYPIRRQVLAAGVAFSLGVAANQPMPFPQSPSIVRLFSDPAGAWQVTLSETSVALESFRYESRDDFCDRAQEVFTAVAELSRPPVVDRIGLRYIDRLTGEDLGRLNAYIAPELCVLYGALGEELGLEHSVSDSVIRIGDNERMQVRSGLLPPNGSFDPALPPLGEPSWLLDLDVFTVQGGIEFQPTDMGDRLRRYADHAYAFFRFATTDLFQEEFRRPLPTEAIHQ